MMASVTDLGPAIDTILRQCLDVKPGENVLVIVDAGTREIGEALRDRASELGADAVLAVMDERATHGAEPPPTIAAALMDADVFIAPTSKSLSHTRARKRATDAGRRGATLPTVTADMLARVMAGDFAPMAARSTRDRRAAHQRARTAHVSCPLGNGHHPRPRGPRRHRRRWHPRRARRLRQPPVRRGCDRAARRRGPDRRLEHRRARDQRSAGDADASRTAASSPPRTGTAPPARAAPATRRARPQRRRARRRDQRPRDPDRQRARGREDPRHRPHRVRRERRDRRHRVGADPPRRASSSTRASRSTACRCSTAAATCSPRSVREPHPPDDAAHPRTPSAGARLLAVPNISEGVDPLTIDAVGAALPRPTDAVLLHDVHSDPDHNRTRLHARRPRPARSRRRLLRRCGRGDRADRHQRPRGRAPARRARSTSRRSSTSTDARAGRRLRGGAGARRPARRASSGCPVFLYGLLTDGRRTRAELRRGGPAGARSAGSRRASWCPTSVRARLHPTAGAVLVGARAAAGRVQRRARAAGDARGRAGDRGAIREGGARAAVGARDRPVARAPRTSPRSRPTSRTTARTTLADVVAAIARHARPARAELVGLAPAAAFEGFPRGPARSTSRRALEEALGIAVEPPIRVSSRAMAQTKRKRRTKHRGNAAGVVEVRGRTGRPPTPRSTRSRTKEQARAARRRQTKPPTLEGLGKRRRSGRRLHVRLPG